MHNNIPARECGCAEVSGMLEKLLIAAGFNQLFKVNSFRIDQIRNGHLLLFLMPYDTSAT